MNRHVNAIAGRLSLRPPQRQSLEILDRVTEIAPPKKGADVAAALAAIRSEFPGVTDFEREFPSLCFALATGVGKTRLMGAFISYLHLAHGVDNFFVLAPNLTIYDKLITDFTPNTPKYVFKGIAEFATDAPEIITGDNYDQRDPKTGQLFGNVRINIFNISKINSEVRGGKSARIKRLSEYLGESYFDYLASLPDLVILMDESHRYRASAAVRAINELKPILGLELTATPFVEAGNAAVAFKNSPRTPPARTAAHPVTDQRNVVPTREANSARNQENSLLTDEVGLAPIRHCRARSNGRDRRWKTAAVRRVARLLRAAEAHIREPEEEGLVGWSRGGLAAERAPRARPRVMSDFSDRSTHFG